MRYAARRVPAQLGFKRRVRLYDSAPEKIRPARVSPLVVPVGVYWGVCALLCYALTSGSLPIARLFDSESTKERKTATRSSPRRVRATPIPTATPNDQLAVAVLPQYPEAPAIPPEPAPIGPAVTQSISAEPTAPPAPAEHEFERSVAARAARAPAREPEPAPKLATKAPERDREPVAVPKPRIPEPAEPVEPAASARSAAAANETAVSARSAAASNGTVGSCEAAIASYSEELDLKKGRTLPPDLPLSRYAAVLERGDYFSHCGVPDDMALEICAAVQNGRAVGITVVTRPASARIRKCVTSAVRSLRFPVHPRLDVTRTRFDRIR